MSTFYAATESKQTATEVHKKVQYPKPDQKQRDVTSDLGRSPPSLPMCDKNTNTEAAGGSQPGNQINLNPVLVHKRESLYFESTKDTEHPRISAV